MVTETDSSLILPGSGLRHNSAMMPDSLLYPLQCQVLILKTGKPNNGLVGISAQILIFLSTGFYRKHL